MDLKLWPVLTTILFLSLLVLVIGLVGRTPWVTALAVLLIGVIATSLALAYVGARRDAAVLAGLTAGHRPGEDTLAQKLLYEIAFSSSEKKPPAQRASEAIRQIFKVDNFVIFFRENDKFVPQVFFGVNKNDLAAPAVQRLAPSLRRDIQNGSISTLENDSMIAFRREDSLLFSRPVAFAYSWVRSRGVFAVFEDPQGFFTEVVKDQDFNRVFWPALENHLKFAARFNEKSLEIRQVNLQLEQAQKDINEKNRELRVKLLDLQSFVKVSGDLYSLFDEEQLFGTLKKTVRTQLGVGSVDILVPSGEGLFISRLPEGAESNPNPLTLNSESELFALLAKSSKPVLLPLASSGLKRDEPFLARAFRDGYQVASAIKTGGQVACILMVGEKPGKAQFTGLDLDFLYIINNIASLSLENIHQYSTIEKLSYTDSMTGVYNYRYFYKRLNEEILRAKRYERELSLVILDIDNFKAFNDNYGHQAGDLVLKQLSDLITKTIRSIDVVSRYGGEEFCIIMPDTGIDNCRTFIERLRAEIADFKFESRLFDKGNGITVSVGGAVYPEHALMPDRLIYCADMALLKAKSLGRNRAVMYQPLLSHEANSTEGGFNESHQESIL